jgi:hypothetical protein
MRSVTAIEIGAARSCARATRGDGYGSGVQKGSRRPTCCPRAAWTSRWPTRFAKPLDERLLTSLAAEHELLVTVEEGVRPGVRLRRRECLERPGGQVRASCASGA